jgi:3-hydroxyisobutyrate dehydrogenase-like beta-hydroxyacid dehydrogenase
MAASRKAKQLKIGVIGLGIIGSRVAASLRAAGYQVYVWSRSPRSAPNFLGSPVEVADLCDFLQIFVSDDEALLNVMRTLAPTLGPRHLVAAHPTISPGAARQAAAIVEERGARYLDAPFTGSKVAAQNAQLVYYIGGSEYALEQARPVLEATSKKILHVGEIGQASVLKIATNMISAATVQTLAEALAVVRGSGINAQKLVEALEYNASRSATSDMKLSAMISENFEPNFSLKHMFKDVQLGMSIANALKIQLPATSATAGAIFGAIKNGFGEQDFSVLSQNYEKSAPRAVAPSPPAAPPAAPAGPAAPAAAISPSSSPANSPADAAAKPADDPAKATPPAAPAAAPVNAADQPPPENKPPAPPPEPAAKSSPKSALRMIRDFLKKEPAKS